MMTSNADEKRILQILHTKAAAYLKQTFDSEADSKSLLSSIRFSDHYKPTNNYLGNPILQTLIVWICNELKQVLLLFIQKLYIDRIWYLVLGRPKEFKSAENFDLCIHFGNFKK